MTELIVRRIQYNSHDTKLPGSNNIKEGAVEIFVNLLSISFRIYSYSKAKLFCEGTDK